MDKIEERVKAIISEQLDVELDFIWKETRLLEDLHADSLDKVELIVVLEMEYSIELTIEDEKSISTVQDIIDCLVRKGVN